MDISLDYSGTNIGKYYLIEKLGNGGFGAVYRAFDRILKVDKAIKIIEVTNPKEAIGLFNEAAIPYKCRHNNIVRINSGELIKFENELLFVVDMELVDGLSVDTLIKLNNLSVVESLRIMKDVLFAVEYSHLQGIIHRDIKPANILIEHGVAKLSDFGLSTVLGKVIIPWRWYRTHAAPETFHDESVATIQTDIYALGMTMYRMVNNIPDWHAFLNQIPHAKNLIADGNLIKKLPVASFVPQKVHKIIKKACKKKPEERYSSAMKMRNAIEKLCPLYSWKKVDELHWQGEALGGSSKEIYISYKRNVIEAVVNSNGRKSSRDSKSFDNIIEAIEYIMNYIRDTTLK